MSDSQINPQDYLVLVCDDEESIRSMLGEALANWGFQVATAPNGEAAIEYMQAGNIPHILLTDIRMGGITGIELAAKAKEISQEIEVIIMTSHGTFDSVVQAMRIGVFDYITKPFDNIEDVRTTLVHVCERIYLRFYTEFLLNELQRKNREIEHHSRTTGELAKNLDLVKVLDIGVKGISEAFGHSPVIFFQYVPSQRALMASTRAPADLLGGAQLKFLLPEQASSDVAAVNAYLEGLKSNTEFLLTIEQAWAMNPNPATGSSLQNALGAQTQWRIEPLITRGIPRGVFACLPNEWNDEDSPALFDRYVQSVSTFFENALLHAKVVQTAIRDSLTGLYNVRYFKDRFQSEMQACSRIGHPLSLLFFDVDHFKKYNDTHGHPAGDQVLRLLAELMRRNFRGTDILARYGGEEFVVLLPHTAFLDALEKAENFRQIVERTPFPNGETQPLGMLSVSIGVAEFPSHGASMEAVVKAADDALYEAKKKSRNVVVPGVPVEGYVPPYQSKPVRSRAEVARKKAAG